MPMLFRDFLGFLIESTIIWIRRSATYQRVTSLSHDDWDMIIAFVGIVGVIAVAFILE
jgi:hypothetical protein